MDAARVVVVDDNVVVRSGLVSLLEASGIEVVGEAGDGRTAIEIVERVRPDLVLLDVQMPLVDGVTAAQTLSRVTRVIMLTYTEDPRIVREAIGNGASGYLVHGQFSAQRLADAVHGALRGANPLSEAAVSALVGALREVSARPDPPGADPGAESGGEPDGDPPAGARPPGRPAGAPSDEGERRVARFGLSARELDVMRLIVQGRTNVEIAGHLFLAEKTVKNHVNRIYAKLGVTSRAAAIAQWMGTAGETTR
ncbi:DNA-binding NarL/FixJ family response regulator [Actinomadura coerulea]|uniref:DNA-binding NarL/FixJ family response regulator n=1 Tax=Actinomadura coerulea TaxID=46159 RepID=A0A7X0L2N9_9ACTN|nr:response regulator transcription factor [Actinomadura coerulea]MBB6399780.1 DNA-binding NarL/FixJ family response regulator [Actinomadura coerulea]GGQ15904.1 DNA-binding response regulator [Actinomadura coerulea]